MATRRDKDLPSHPSTSPGGRPRIPEREITTTDVTQHASEVLTDQDFVITSPDEGDYFRHDGSDWINQAGVPFSDLTGSIAGGQVPEAVVTQHEAALTIAESQITDGSLLARLGDAETVTGAWTFESILTLNSSGELLRLQDSSESGNPYLSFFQAGFWRAFIQYVDSSDVFNFRNRVGGLEFTPADNVGLKVSISTSGDLKAHGGDVIAIV